MRAIYIVLSNGVQRFKKKKKKKKKRGGDGEGASGHVPYATSRFPWQTELILPLETFRRRFKKKEGWGWEGVIVINK